MADSTSHKTQKVEKLKYTNMISRTTSESIRLGESDIINHPTTLSAISVTPKKKTSFQITSVTVGGHSSNDGGDDSADDLDESHAEDISEVVDTSRATDIENETPSFSEDTFSKDDVFFNSSTSLGSAPVIPTSSQYGLAIVSTPEGCSNILNSNNPNGINSTSNDLGLHVNISDNVINLGIVGTKHLDGEMRDLHSHTARNERFKVVKIESTEPFKRGRWMCMDFLDHTMSQQNQTHTQGSVNSNDSKAIESIDLTSSTNVNQCAGTDSGISLSDHPNITSNIEDQVVDSGMSLNSNNIPQEQACMPHTANSSQNSVSPGQTMQFSTQSGNVVPNGMNVSQSHVLQQQAQSLTSISSQHTIHGTNQHQSLQPQQIQQVLSTTNMHSQPTLLNQQVNQTNNQIQQQPNHQIHQSGQQIQQSSPQMQQPNQQIQQPNQQIQQSSQHMQQSNQQVQQSSQQIPQPSQQIQQSNQQIQQASQQMQQPNQQIQQSNQQIQQPNQQIQHPNSQMQQQNQQIQQPNQQIQQSSQQLQSNQQIQQSNQPFQQSTNQTIQHQGLPLQHVHHQIHQSQAGNIVPQQYQQSQIQQIHQQANIQAVQQNNQGMLQQQPTIPQHIQHQHISTMPVQQQMNQGQMSVQIPQTVVPNQNIQQIQQQAPQMPVHSQIPNSAQHMQHVSVQHLSAMSGVVGPSTQVHPTQTSQQQQYHHHPTSQPMMQAGIQAQQNLMPVQSQYFTNTQITGNNMNIQPLPNSVIQSQTQSGQNLNLQTYPVNSISQQQSHQIPIPHVIPTPTNISHLTQPPISTSGPVMISQPGSLSVINSLPVPSGQSTVISPQATSLGSTLVQQQYISQPACSQSNGGLQSYVSSTVNAVPSVMDNLQVYSNDISSEQTAVLPSNQQTEILADSIIVEELQVEDPESIRGLALALATTSSLATPDTPVPNIVCSNESSTSGTNAVAIDNKIEQAMDLVKSHLMFAVREEVEVLKEKIAELMEKINQLEMENAVLKAHASQETLAQLSASNPPS